MSLTSKLTGQQKKKRNPQRQRLSYGDIEKQLLEHFDWLGQQI